MKMENGNLKLENSQVQNSEPKAAKESGVATILAIGISALFLMLGIAFVTTSMIEKKASMNYQSINQARALAQTAFNRAMANMKLLSSKTEESMNEITSHDRRIASDDSATRLRYGHGLAEALTTVIDGDTYLEIPSDYPFNAQYDITDTAAVTWIYFYHPIDNCVFGRISYVVLPNKGKIDPWAVIDSGVNAAQNSKTPPSEVNYGGGNTSVASDGSFVVGRPGRDITELCLKSLEYDSDSFISSYTEKMSVKTCSPTGLVDTGISGKWEDFEQLFSKLGIAENNKKTRQYFKEVFYLNAPPDAEKYWVDDNYDLVRDPSEMQDRFNLARTDWGSLTINDIGNSNTLRWLAKWNDFDSTGNSTKAQVIANLIDYCDADNNPTTDYPEVDPPTYVGLEKVPYINEVVIRIKGRIWRTGSSGSYVFNFATGSYSGTVGTSYPDINVEVVDMYGSSISTKAYVDNMKIEYDFGKSSNPEVRITTDSAVTTLLPPATIPTIAAPNNSYVASGQYNFTSGALNTTKTSSQLGNLTSARYMTIKLRISDLRIRLVNAANNQLCDYANLPATPWIELVPSVNNQDRTYYLAINFQVADPRQNLNELDWQGPATSASYYAVGTANTTNCGNIIGYGASTQTLAKNTIFTPNSGGNDPEPSATQPWLISTAYIRNAPMKSPWELGFIHRAKAFQTINLKKFNDSADGNGFGPNAGGGSYSLGDANILDQIKMTSNSVTQGKINLNSDNKSVLRTLFDQIKIGSSKDDPGNGGSAVSTANANAIAITILSKNGTTGGAPFYTRAGVVNDVAALTNGAYGTQTTDATQEEIIGKFINLTKVETPDLFTVIAVGQSIKDVGPDTGSIPVYKDLNADGDVSDEGETIQASKGTFDVNADIILASQKIFAKIKRKSNSGSGTDSFYIQDMMYIDN